MRIIGHGVDLLPVERIGRLIDRHGRRFLERCFTERERAYAQPRRRRLEHLAARFAAKEAVLKALGTGWRSGIAWTDVEIVLRPSGEPTVALRGRAARIAERCGIDHWWVSLSHCGDLAIASVIAASER